MAAGSPFDPSRSPDDEQRDEPASARPPWAPPGEAYRPPSGRGGTRPSWSDGTFFVVILLLLVAFGAGLVVDRSGLFEGGTAAAPPASGSSGTSVAQGTIGPGVTVPPEMPADFGLFWQSLDLIRQHYVDQSALTNQAITYGAISGVVDQLGDPGHTVFLTPDDVKSEQQALDGTIVGIGVFLSEPAGGGLVIQSVISGTPADKAGLRALDRIIAVNSQSVENMSVPNVAALIRGPEGTTVELTVIPNGESAPRTVTITRAKISVPAVSWAMVPGTKAALIHVTQFSQNTTSQLKQALQSAQAQGATGIVLDLREDPGGLVDEAVGVASQFLGDGIVYIRQDAQGTQVKVPVKGGGLAPKTPLVVLVDYGTASSAEIVAGALQDNDRARVVGVRTFGTGTVLNTFNLADGSALRLAVEEWLTPNGRKIFPGGITPDTKVELAAGTAALEPEDLAGKSAADVASSGDAQLLAALQELGATP
ncbi:MAG: S41 family peptidase [Candidatus Limnocylindrales bacterium]